MPSYSVDLDVLRHALLGHSLAQVGDSLLQASVTAPLRISNLAFAPSASLAVRVLNRPEDKDDDAVFGDKAGAHIPYALQSAWVKYTLSAKVEGKLGFAHLDAKRGSNVELSDYRLHDATEGAWGALTGDLAEPRTLLELDDVRKLRPGEALKMDAGGTLTASVSFSWSDALSTKLADVLHELPVRPPVTVKLKHGLEATAAVKLTDRFSIVISRTRDGRFRFAVQKAQSRSHEYGIELAYGMEVSGMSAVDEVLDPIYDAVKERIPSDQPVDELRSKLRKRLGEVLRWKASTGFAYEYARIDENTAIADFILLDDARLAEDHALVLSGDFARITDTLRNDTSAHNLVRYLNEDKLTRRSSFGFSLGIVKWTDQSVFTQTTRTSLDGFRLVTSRGTRKYEEKHIPQNDFEWVVDLKAEMNEFALTPSTRDFDYGLHFLVTLERSAISEGDLERMLDFAAMWDICTPPASELAEAIGKKGSIRVQLLFERDALMSLSDASVDSFAEPLALAMPHSSNFPERRTFTARREVYTDAWRAWLREEPYAIHVKSGLAIFERQARPGSFAWTAGMGHPHLRARMKSFLRGVRLLREAMTTAHEPSAIGHAYDALQEFWSQRLYVAAAGRWLLDRADANRTLQFELGEKTVTV